MVTFPVIIIIIIIIIIIVIIIKYYYYYYYYYCYICMEEKIIQKQLKKVQNLNTETNEEEKCNWDSKRYRVAPISILSSVMFSNTLFQKISTYLWAQFCAPQLMCQRKFYVAFLFSFIFNSLSYITKIYKNKGK